MAREIHASDVCASRGEPLRIKSGAAPEVTYALTGKVYLGIKPINRQIDGFKPPRGEIRILAEVKVEHLLCQMWSGPQLLCRVATKWSGALQEIRKQFIHSKNPSKPGGVNRISECLWQYQWLDSTQRNGDDLDVM